MTCAADMLKPLVEKGIAVSQFIQMCREHNDKTGEDLTSIPLEYCPVNLYAFLVHKNPCKSVVPGLSTCPICGHAMCPVCSNHSVSQISRVTGYMSSVDGWNEAKKQELKDRRRNNITGRN